MAELREDSLLFSLETLMARERERVQLDRAENERQEALAAAALAAREKERLEAALLHERKRELERAEEQRRMAEHAAKLDSLRQAELVRAQAEAKARSESELLATRHAHERSLAELALHSKRSRDRALAIWSGALLALLLPTALLFHFAHTVPRTRELEGELRKLISLERARADVATQQLATSVARARELEGEVGTLRASLEVRSGEDSSTTRPNRTPSAPQKATHSATRVPTKSRGTPCRDSGDPLDPCLH
jgi:colicin import membrane protein